MVTKYGNEAIEDVKEFIDTHKSYDLVITDVPISTLKKFKELSNSEDFRCKDNKGGHYGFCLKRANKQKTYGRLVCTCGKGTYPDVLCGLRKTE